MSSNTGGIAPDYLSQLRLDNRGFVVLGAGQGIGEQAAHALAQAGARVMCVDRDEQLARNIAETVGGVACAADVTSRSDMQRVFDTARQAFGRVHGVVDIIGVAGIKPLSDVDDAGDPDRRRDDGRRRRWLYRVRRLDGG
jgi:NAD(P)-dependent dehydrogenase (short-subunit alcohol dehydrogenase family)